MINNIWIPIINILQFKPIKLLGNGLFGTVYLV